jgi:hypothetical protein
MERVFVDDSEYEYADDQMVVAFRSIRDHEGTNAEDKTPNSFSWYIIHSTPSPRPVGRVHVINGPRASGTRMIEARAFPSLCPIYLR